ncbi:selection and upkeep of intraepithelial T-cells protein 8-like isoform X1 [Carassius carassius]|uniref:selection and upkeep of intraepithelial T-cells protein 8-like isoform X1 n=1 Tax=Carassius carassius TaxID=217509 RepID=UPI0028694E9E|nr:selection and upkeep of intraepithelial T-cells protein 8-like isoform X1 [Carassius carassius]
MDLWVTGNLRRWWLFYFLPVFLLTSEVSLKETVEGFIGGSAVLPCSSKEPPLTVQDVEVLWRHRGHNVYSIINGQVSVEGQDPEYKNRTESFPEEYLSGNFSIKLNNLQHTDAGSYKCYISEKSVIKNQKKVELLTKESKAIQIPNKGTKPRPDVIIMIIYVLCLCIIFQLTNSVTVCF